MKIIIFSHSSSSFGGAEKCLVEYTEVLLNYGHEILVILPSEGELKPILEGMGIKIEIINYGWQIRRRMMDKKGIILNNGYSLSKSYDITKRFKPNIIITNTVVIPWGFYIAKALGIPNILLVHEIISEKDKSLDMYPNLDRYMNTLNNSVDYVIFNSEFVKNEYRKLNKPKISKNILYPIPPVSEEDIKGKYRENIFSENAKIAIFGVLAPRKNQLEAVEAISILKKKGIEVNLDLFGDENADISYVKLIKDKIRKDNLSLNVRIMGYANDVYKEMNNYNIILNTSTFEPFGRTIIEAQLFGRIVLSNNTGGGAELIIDKETGYIYEAKSPNDLATKIEYILNNKNKATKLAGRTKNIQFNKYLRDDRYNPLLQAVDYYKNYDIKYEDNIFNPIVSLAEYNRYLDIKYRKYSQISNNSMILKLKKLLKGVRDIFKKVFCK